MNHAPKNPLRTFREEAGLSRAALAERLGVTEATIWRWEHGERMPRRKDLDGIRRETNGAVTFDGLNGFIAAREEAAE